jgi:hypothetical protein
VSCQIQPYDPVQDGPRTGGTGLLGVGRWAQWKRLWTQLVVGAVDRFTERGIQDITVVAQGRNSAVQGLYQRCGFLADPVQLWYHKWYEHGK